MIMDAKQDAPPLQQNERSAARPVPRSVLFRFDSVRWQAVYFGNNSPTSAFSSFNSFTVASIFERLNSLIDKP